jgi:hypothetical protein
MGRFAEPAKRFLAWRRLHVNKVIEPRFPRPYNEGHADHDPNPMFETLRGVDFLISGPTAFARSLRDPFKTQKED